MTVRVRQLTRVTTTGIIIPPEPPPVPPTMFFVQQPTTTQVNELFNPPISVRVSDHEAGDLLVLQLNSGTCDIGFFSAFTDAQGIGTFAANAGENVSQGCTIRVNNFTRPEIDAIVSQPFNVTAPPVENFFEIVNNGNAIGVLGTENNQGIFLSRQANGQRFDTTGADLIIVLVNSDVLPNLFYFVNDQETDAVFTLINASTFTGQRLYYLDPPVTGPNAAFSLSAPNGYSSMGAICLRNWNRQPPIQTDFTDYIFSSAMPTTIRLPEPLPTAANNLVVAWVAFWRAVFVSGRIDYENLSYPFSIFSNYGIGMGVKLRSDSPSEDPSFVLNPDGTGSAYFYAAGAIFEPREA